MTSHQPESGHPTVASIDAWLATKPCTLWADWHISQPARRRLAAEWFFAQMNEWSGEPALGLVSRLAGCVMDGEDVDGEPFDMSNDDAVDLLHGFISDARELVGNV